MSATKIHETTNYALFQPSDGNRPTDLKKHKKLEASMRRYGFLKSYPVVCSRADDGRLVIKDGQHRWHIATKLGLPIYWVEETIDFDIAVINCTPKSWSLHDYAAKFSRNGVDDYKVGLEFAAEHRLPVGAAFALLAGTVSFGNCQDDFLSGAFRVKDREWAEAVAGVYVPMVGMAKGLRNARFLEACMAVCRVPTFDPKRLLANANRTHEKISRNCSTRDGFLDMLEEVYNHGRMKFPLKIEAQNAMRARNAALKARRSKRQSA